MVSVYGRTFLQYESSGWELLGEDGELESSLTEYSIGNAMIYTAFAWSVADEAYSTVKELAKKHGVGFLM